MAFILHGLRTLDVPMELMLESKTAAHFFKMEGVASCRRGRSKHESIEALVRRDIRKLAEGEAARWEVDEAQDFQDSLNAELGHPNDCVRGCYRDLTAKFEVRSTADGRQAALNARLDRARIERFKLLRAALYSDPTLLLVSQLEQHPELTIDQAKVDEAWRISSLFRHNEEWWAPLMQAWSSLAGGIKTEEASLMAVQVLVDAIGRLDKSLIEKFGISVSVDAE